MTDSKVGFSLSGLAIRRHVGTLMLTLCLTVVAIVLAAGLQVDLLPSITYPRIGVRLAAPGVAPAVAVEEITKPLEEALSTTEGVVQVFSRTREGDISLDLFFEPGGNLDRALNDATAAFNRARSQLPPIVEEPRLFKIDPTQLPVYELALASGQRSPAQLRLFAEEELARELSTVSGVASVDVTGGLEEEVRVLIDPERLQAFGLGLDQVLNELRDSNQDLSGGRLRSSTSEPLTRTRSRFQAASSLENLVFERAGSVESTPQQVRLSDFAQVIDGTAEPRIFVNLNGNPAVRVSIQKQPEANTVAVVEGVKRRLEQMRTAGQLPDDLQLLPILDESVFIGNALANVISSGLAGAGLAALAVLLFLGSLRQAVIILLSIPLATLTALLLMRLFGLSLNIISLGGLALGVGIVVDNSIVMLETIAQDVEMAKQRGSADPRFTPRQLIDLAADSSQQVESALVASTSTNLVVVLPFLLLGGFIALLFNELILTISFAVAASIGVALTVVPMLASRWLAWEHASGLAQWPLLRRFNLGYDSLQQHYGRFLERVLRYPLRTVLLTFLILGLSSFWIVGQLPQEILPRINTGQARLTAIFPPGTSLETNRRVMQAVDRIFLAQPETDAVFSTVGGFLFGTSTTTNALRSSSTIILKPGSNLESFVERVNRQLEQLNLVDTLLRLRPGEVRGLIVSNTPVRGADVDIGLQGNDAKSLANAGRQVFSALSQQAKLARYRPDGDRPEPELQIRLDRERVAALGLNPLRVGETIQTAVEGTVPTRLQRGDRLVDIRVEVDDAALAQPTQLAQLPLFAPEGQPIRLGDLAQLEMSTAPSEIQRLNQRQVFQIAGNLNEGASLGAALAEADRILRQVQLPTGVTRLPSGAAEANRQLQASLPILGVLAAFLVYVVMAVQYNSLIDPLVILFTLPLALAGGLWGLYLTGKAIGATVIVGVVLLIGIVVNNAIILIELANQIREQEQVDRRLAILKAAPQRLRPVLMTTITTVLGMLPLALGIGAGSEFLQPLGIVVFAGLSLATLLTLFIIPCFYLLLHQLMQQLRPSTKVRTHQQVL
jgi:CzcA family heavy metal efflux pump